MVRFYRLSFASLLGGRCRFEPSCSQYAEQAFEQKPFIEAVSLVTRRILKCHPWGGFGYDPVLKGDKK